MSFRDRVVAPGPIDAMATLVCRAITDLFGPANDVLVAAAIGFTLAAGAAFVLEFLDDTIKTDDDVDRVLGMPTLGTISRIPRVREPSDNLVSMHYPYSPITEVYRVLRTNIQFSSLNFRYIQNVMNEQQ